jgi:hypothetical protein
MNILLTGSTAAHVSTQKNSRTITFPGLIYKALVSGHHDVTWIEPSVSMSRDYIAEFDAVIVGVAPPTSTAAHRIYGSLSVINYAWEVGNLRLLIDAPEPRRIWAGLKAIHNSPNDLIKDFYSKRSEYRKARNQEVFDRIYNAVDLLFTQRWPLTYFPQLPWMSFPSVSSYIPMVGSPELLGLCFDRKMIESSTTYTPTPQPEFWVADAISTRWTKQQESLVSLPVVSLKTSRWEDSSEAMQRLSESIGCMASVYRNNDPWWTPSISQALSVGVPVVTDWLLSSMLGESWAVLPGSIEDMTHAERSSLAYEQAKSYASALLTWEDSVDLLTRSLVD